MYARKKCGPLRDRAHVATLQLRPWSTCATTAYSAGRSSGYRLALEIQFLQLQIQRRSQLAEAYSIHLKAIELMSMDRNVLQAAVRPLVFLIDSHAHKMRHDVGQPMVVISFDPYHFHIAFGIGQFANVAEKLPMILGQAREIKVCENVAQQDQALKPASALKPALPRAPGSSLNPGGGPRGSTCCTRADPCSISNNPMLRSDEHCIKIRASVTNEVTLEGRRRYRD